LTDSELKSAKDLHQPPVLAKASQACAPCRNEKVKCNRALPSCARCKRIKEACDYSYEDSISPAAIPSSSNIIPPLTAEPAPIQDGNTRSEGREEVQSSAEPKASNRPIPPLKLLVLLRGKVLQEVRTPAVFTDWKAPTTGALLGSSPARFGVAPWELEPSSVVQSIIARDTDSRSADYVEAQSFSDARRLSIAERERLSVDSDAENTFQESVEYMKNIIATRTSKEKEDYESICKRMSGCETRPAEAERILSRPDWSWSTLAIYRDDDWWHCRRLLQMIAQRCSFHHNQYRGFEERLLQLLAATEGGSTEALLWLMPLEGLLREISQSALGKDSSPGIRITLSELTIFVHGVTIRNLMLRTVSAKTSNGPPEPPLKLQKWYTALFKMDPRCSNQACLRLLPSPRTVRTDNSRHLIAVGVKDPRAGIKEARAFISSNRGTIYDCIVKWLPRRSPEPILLCAFFWFGTMTHVLASCSNKAGRGVYKTYFT
jgi:hypothetical protein